MQPFNPCHIYVEEDSRHDAVTRRVLDFFSDVPIEIIPDKEILKKPLLHTQAKKNLLLARHQGKAIHSCQGMGDYVCCNYLTISLVSNCHLECTYCILQDYLKNNPIITIYTNTDEILSALEHHLKETPQTLFRVGTGELSDSLALDHITGFSRELVSFAAKQKNLILELKTKSDQIENLLDLDHGGKTVVSWSVNPQKYAEQEELKCASLPQRLQAARSVADAGYPVGFHLDPLLAFSDWQEQYPILINELAKSFDSTELAWISFGSLRYTPGLKNIVQERFPKSRILYEELYPTSDGKVRYFREIREELYSFVKEKIDKAFPSVPHYLCMETPTVWKNVYHDVPLQDKLEQRLAERFVI